MNKLGTIVLICISTALYAHPGVGIVMDTKGNVFYTDLKQIWKVDPRGRRTVAVPRVHAHELYLDANDNLFGEHLWYEGEATDKWGHYVWKLSVNGTLSIIIPKTEGFLQHYSLVRNEKGEMYWADRDTDCQKIVRKSPTHTATLGDKCLSDVRWMTSSAKGNLYFTDGPDLKKMNAHGNIETLAGDLKEKKLTQLQVNDRHMLMGVWTDKIENVYVAVFGARKVQKVTPDGKISTVVETRMGWSPTGGLVAPNGDYWLLECSTTNAVRVEQITTDGRRIIYGE